MSGYPPGGQFEENENSAIERRLQEEFRVRQANSGRVPGALAFAPRAADQNFMTSLMAESAATSSNPYYARQVSAAAAGAASSPYYSHPGALAQPPGAPVGYGASDAVTATLYAHRTAAQYGYATAASAANAAAVERAYGYGAVPSARDLYSQHFAHPSQEMSVLDRAAAYNAQQRQAEQQSLMQQQQQQQQQQQAQAQQAQQQQQQQQSGVGAKPPAAGQGQAMSFVQNQTSPPPKQSPRSQQPAGGTPKPVVRLAPTIKSTKKSTPSKTTPKKPAPTVTAVSARRKKEQEDLDNKRWFSGCVPLGLDDDKYWLSELQVYLRSSFAESFGATEEDIAAPMHGRNKPIALGQVGIRCMHCKHENPAERGQQATSYPSLISGIYNSVQQMLRLHLDCCQSMPPDVRLKIEQLKLSSSSRGGRKQYWIDSAKRLGLVDTPHGIHFGRDPHGPLPPLSGPSVNSKEGRKKKENETKGASPGTIPETSPSSPEEKAEAEADTLPPIPQVEERPLVFPEDKPLISDYLYLTLEQMSPCVLMEADRVGCYKTRKVGFPGLACKHCVGQAGCGRYFPASEASLSQTTTSQTIMNHVRNCRRCPIEIRENLEIMKRARMGPDGKRADKPKHGGRKVFFHRLWCRIQGLPMEDGKGEPKEKKKRKIKTPTKKSPKKKAVPVDKNKAKAEESSSPPKKQKVVAKPARVESSDDTSDSERASGDSSEEDADRKSKSKSATSKASSVSAAAAAAAKPSQRPWCEGCVTLTKTDDSAWLSEMQRFARSELVEVFSFSETDTLHGYNSRKEPAIGQVGIRCAYCKTLPPEQRSSGGLVFPDSLSAINSKLVDMIRLHFPSCPGMPADKKETFKSLRNFGSKALDDRYQYWIDSARDIGLSAVPPGGQGVGWGISFRRDPLEPSPSDDLEREKETGEYPELDKNCLVRPEDRDTCTDEVLLLMRQVQPCTFQKRDRRVGPGPRGRDRVIGFPGLCCKWCANKTNIGRYFPVSTKNLTVNTSNSLLTHLTTCSRCPETIKASLAFLAHRSILQKAKISGCWKTTFFKKIWERLHVERTWSEDKGKGKDGKAKDGKAKTKDDASATASNKTGANGTPTKDGKADGKAKGDPNDEDMGEGMNALIKAAAIWLTEEDQATDATRGVTRSRSRPTSASAKRSATVTPRSKSRGSSLTSGKRRRVHF